VHRIIIPRRFLEGKLCGTLRLFCNKKSLRYRNDFCGVYTAKLVIERSGGDGGIETACMQAIEAGLRRVVRLEVWARMLGTYKMHHSRVLCVSGRSRDWERSYPEVYVNSFPVSGVGEATAPRREGFRLGRKRRRSRSYRSMET
jgi:hypothetical protein